MRNWKRVNDNLVKRGMLWVDFSFLRGWDEEVEELNKGKVGRRYVYPNTLFYLASFITCFMPFRQAEGFLRGLSKVKKFEVPDYTTVFRRVRKLDLSMDLKKLDEDFVVAIDSSGIKVTNRGDWLREIHGKKRKGWLKFHVAVDIKDKKLVGLSVTDEKVGDNSEFKNLINQALKFGKPSKLLADSAYDSRENFNLLTKLGIKPGIKPRKVEVMPKGWIDLKKRRPRVKARGSMMRKKHVLEYSLDPEGWKKKVGYGKRWVVEIFFSSFKRIFGEHVRARKFENMVNELMIKAMVYNSFISL